MTFEKYDEIVVHTCTKHEARLPPLKAELARIGINAIFQYNDESAHANVRETLQRAVDRGYKRVLCLEDDVRFLKDAELVQSMFIHAPEAGCDICSFDNFIQDNVQKVIAIRSGQPRWVYYHEANVFGASCWSFGDKAARVLLASYDAHTNEPPDSQMFMRHQDLVSAFITPNACIQVFYKGCINDTKGWKLAHHAGYAFLNYAAYNVPEGYTFGGEVDE